MMTMSEGLFDPEGILKEIIKLQLKKPKRWNWELTTSKSSPHICLPVIQLFDSKGKLLVEARDSGKGAERRTWHSAQMQTSVAINPHVRRSGSDNLGKNVVAASPNKEIRRSLRKSNSDVFQTKPTATPAASEQRDKSRPARQYKRTNSDDVYKRMLKRTESDRINENHVAPEEADWRPKYEARTCNAGTILVKRDSLDLANIRRRRRGRHAADERRAAAAAAASDRYKSVEPPCNINRRAKGPEKFDNANDYVVEEPSDADNRDNVRGNVHRQNTGDTTSSGAAESFRRELTEIAFWRKKFRSNSPKTTARVAKNQIDSNKDKTGVELERLVSRLSSNEDVKMGANVSRHSSKGLSGRRTQSSGSICKGRKNNNENQICGSLPSYLDEREASCNNNHDYEKLPINDVDRIPPLGDGAPLHWKFSDNQTVLCDQGYGSERSPEEEYPPPLPEHDNQCHHHLDIHSCYPFITPESTFCVSLAKGSRGLGLSVTGGIDSGGSWPGLIRVKRLFPHQPAAACGVLNVGDLILEANGVPLTGLTNYEALEVLRTSPNQVELRICRPPPDVLNCVSPISEVPPPPPRREPPSSLSLTPGHLTADDDQYNGEFEITMRKMQGSLGFTLRKEDDSALGHYIRALVREPALNDGRIRPGDKIIAVNDIEISSMSHEEAVQFLRKCGDLVKLRLYRDAAQTPVATLSPTETTPRTSFSRKAQLRQEAVDMLNDIAVRKLMPSQDSYRHPHSPTSSPRRIRSRQNCPSDASQDSTSHYHPMEEQFHEGLLQHGGHLPLDEETFNSLFIQDDEDGDRPSRPSSLELYNPNQTPVACRKPKFNFSLAHNAYELNNLDAEILDAPNLTYNMGDDVNSTEVECGDSFPKEPASMPHLQSDSAAFSYKNPAYQSAHPPCGSENGMVDEKKTADEHTRKKSEEEPEKKPRRKKSIKERTVPEEPQILAIELNRGWNSRLGFSLQGPTGQTYVSAVHADSVAAKDGRIKAGDRVIKVNDESVEHMSTNEIIELLRIVRGPVCIVVIRNRTMRDCIRSNAVN